MHFYVQNEKKVFTNFIFYNLEYDVPIGKQGQTYNFHKYNFANLIKA